MVTTLTRGLLNAVMPSAHNGSDFLPHLTAAAVEFEINTPQRLVAWLAQMAHESAQLKFLEEIASGDAYEGRADLGNVKPGDGRRYKGRGPLQITGLANYEACGEALGLNLVDNPELLATSLRAAARSAAWYWKSRGLNEAADRNAFGTITRKVNGGFNHLDQRCAFWAAGLIYIGAQKNSPPN
jgi:putative chitinase